MAAIEQGRRCFAGPRRITSWSLSVCAYDDALTQAGYVTLTRDPATGFLTGTTLGNVTDSRTFNGFGEISGYTAAVSGTPLYTAACTRDALGRLSTQTEMIGGATVEKVYAYDVRGRLTSVTTDGIVSEWYAYDLNGNRTNSMAGEAFYDAQDLLLASGDVAFTHDANGSRVSQLLTPNSSLLTTYTYDLFGQLKSVTLPDGRAVSYDRDALNRVTAKRVNGVIVKGWIYKDALKPIAETDADGNVISFFVYGTSPFSPDYMVKDGITYRLIRDNQGSVRLAVNADTGAVAQRIDYDAFGRSVSTELTQSGNNAITQFSFQPFGFQSGLYDPDTGLVQFGARWYDPETGRWLSKDPILLEGGLNLYAFCGNDPVNFVDPLGLFQFGKRPLEGAPWIPGGSSNPIDNYFNTEISHEHGFFEDGSDDNIGFGLNGRFSENPAGKGYRYGGPHYDDALMREALKNLQDGDYSLLGWGSAEKNNCQDWSDRLRAEYDRLLKKRDGDKCK